MGLVAHLLTPLADAWLQVGVWVGAMLAVFSTGGRVVTRLTGLLGRRGWGPVVGAALGVSPGCGGAVVVMPVYAAGRAGFGTVVATLVATMGDSSFVLLAAEPDTGVAIHAGLFALGVGTGLAVDALGIAPRRRTAPVRVGLVPAPAVSTVGAARVPVGLMGRPAPLRGGLALWLFWACVAAGLVLAIAVQFGGVAVPAGGAATWHVVGVSGTAFALLVAVAGRRDHPPESQGTLRERLAGAARETATITAWVTVAFLLFGVASALTGGAVAALPGHGLLAVVLAALVGLVPGCGPQILLTTLYVQGAIGVPALLANAVSQDGDALFPLMARERGAAAWATVVTTVPALLVGVVAWLVLGGR